jgi:hypothetical protein
MKPIVYLVAVSAFLATAFAPTPAWGAAPSATFITLVDSTGKTESTCKVGTFLKLSAGLVFSEGNEDGETSVMWTINTTPSKAKAVVFVDPFPDDKTFSPVIYFAEPVDLAEITVSILQDGLPHPTRKATYIVHVVHPISSISLTDDDGKADSICSVHTSGWKLYTKLAFADSVFTPKLAWKALDSQGLLSKSILLEKEDDFTYTLSIKGYDTAAIVVTVLKADGNPDPYRADTYKVYVPLPDALTLSDANGKTADSYAVGDTLKLHAAPDYGRGNILVVPKVDWKIDGQAKEGFFKDNNSYGLDRTVIITAPDTVGITAAVVHHPEDADAPDRSATYTLRVPTPEPVSLTLTDKSGNSDSTCKVGAQLQLHVEPSFANKTQQGLFDEKKISPQLVWLINGLPEEESSLLSLDGNANTIERNLLIKAPGDPVQITVAVRRADGSADPLRRAVYTLHIPVPKPDALTLTDADRNSSSTHVVGDQVQLQVSYTFNDPTQKALNLTPPVVWLIKTDPQVSYTSVAFTDNHSSALIRTLSVLAPVDSVEIIAIMLLPDGTADLALCDTYILRIPEPVTELKLKALNENESKTWKAGDTLRLQAIYTLGEGNDLVIPRFAWWIEMDPPAAPSSISFVDNNAGDVCRFSVIKNVYGTANVKVAVIRPDGAPYLTASYPADVREPEPTAIQLADLSGKTESTGIVGNLLQLRAQPLFPQGVALGDLQNPPKVLWQILSLAGQESSAAAFVDNNASGFDRTLAINEPVDLLQIIVAIQIENGLMAKDTYLLHIPVPEPVSIILTDLDGNTSSTHLIGEQIAMHAKPVFANAVQNNLQLVPKVLWEIEEIPLEQPPVVSFKIDDEENEENVHGLVRNIFMLGYGTAHVTVSLLRPDDTPDPIRRATYTLHVSPYVPEPTPTPTPEPTPASPASPTSPPPPTISLFPQAPQQPVVTYSDATLHLRHLAGYTVHLVSLTGQGIAGFTVPADDYSYPLPLAPAIRILFATNGVNQYAFKLLVD